MDVNLKKDRMAKNERWVALLNRRPLDRVPVCGFTGGFSLVHTGLSIADFYNEPRKSYESQMRVAEKFGFQEIPRIAYAGFGGWEFGGEIKWPSGAFAQAPMILKYRVQKADDISGLSMPDIKTAGIIPNIMQICRLVDESGSPYIWGLICGPFTIAGNICGMNTLARWLIRNPEAAHRLMTLATEFMIDLAQYYADSFGAPRVILDIGDPSTSNQVISPKQFENFVLPYATKLADRVLGTGIKHIFLHACGEQNANLPSWSNVPLGDPGIVSVGHEVDLDIASKYFPGHVIMGNIEPALIQTGTPDRIYEAARVCIIKGRKHLGGFILSPGCELPPLAPEPNVWAIMQAVSDYGWYE